ncbi:TetR/AcrR family transcriptional regulator [Paeniglutamicibacter psychrophenolicus]|uniref:TetR/AcrR family transcriptional regulator n=1 Tax=Paeniglutamicibacter psychrophenolicus TaxID=257454 RepID=UPI0027884BC6|nr:TetR/AcrR family transcriptional regulator [Paeniglutamicibacter psychrophenolicus]MDQ0094802.1 AcrR family transcriptional regulator [Paeniglutamicibacter psychrophenolicus]
MKANGKDLAATDRDRAKAQRREDLLAEATRLFAIHGYAGVSLEDLGAACGISGPAVYRHFSGKPAVLIALLVGVSEDMLEGGRKVTAAGGGAEAILRRLIAFHTDFALARPDIIQVQDRHLVTLPAAELQLVRKLQRSYIALWTDQLHQIHPEETNAVIRFRAHAAFGLLNSTAHSAHSPRTSKAGLRKLLNQMAASALFTRVG